MLCLLLGSSRKKTDNSQGQILSLGPHCENLAADRPPGKRYFGRSGSGHQHSDGHTHTPNQTTNQPTNKQTNHKTSQTRVFWKDFLEWKEVFFRVGCVGMALVYPHLVLLFWCSCHRCSSLTVSGGVDCACVAFSVRVLIARDVRLENRHQHLDTHYREIGRVA